MSREVGNFEDVVTFDLDEEAAKLTPEQEAREKAAIVIQAALRGSSARKQAELLRTRESGAGQGVGEDVATATVAETDDSVPSETEQQQARSTLQFMDRFSKNFEIVRNRSAVFNAATKDGLAAKINGDDFAQIARRDNSTAILIHLNQKISESGTFTSDEAREAARKDLFAKFAYLFEEVRGSEEEAYKTEAENLAFAIGDLSDWLRLEFQNFFGKNLAKGVDIDGNRKGLFDKLSSGGVVDDKEKEKVAEKDTSFDLFLHLSDRFTTEDNKKALKGLFRYLGEELSDDQLTDRAAEQQKMRGAVEKMSEDMQDVAVRFLEGRDKSRKIGDFKFEEEQKKADEEQREKQADSGQGSKEQQEESENRKKKAADYFDKRKCAQGAAALVIGVTFVTGISLGAGAGTIPVLYGFYRGAKFLIDKFLPNQGEDYKISAVEQEPPSQREVQELLKKFNAKSAKSAAAEVDGVDFSTVAEPTVGGLSAIASAPRHMEVATDEAVRGESDSLAVTESALEASKAGLEAARKGDVAVQDQVMEAVRQVTGDSVPVTTETAMEVDHTVGVTASGTSATAVDQDHMMDEVRSPNTSRIPIPTEAVHAGTAVLKGISDITTSDMADEETADRRVPDYVVPIPVDGDHQNVI